MKNLKSFFNKKNIDVVFSHEYVSVPDANITGMFDILKYKKIRDKLVENKLVKRKKFLKPYKVSYENMGLIHSEKYLTHIKEPLNVAKILNIGNVDPWDSYILEYFRVVTGGTVLATFQALKSRGTVFNLGGGFHHAQKEKGAGFCLVNDVAIAIQKARQKNKAQKFLIVDLDYHQGDGNLLIFKDDEDVFTFSIHASHWQEIIKENNLDVLVSSDCENDEYMDVLKNNLYNICMRMEPDLVFYIAGSDPYEKDALCDMKLSRDTMLERNKFVLEKIQNFNVPLVVVAGGGYGPDSWEVYYDFIKYALS